MYLYTCTQAHEGSQLDGVSGEAHSSHYNDLNEIFGLSRWNFHFSSATHLFEDKKIRFKEFRVQVLIVIFSFESPTVFFSLWALGKMLISNFFVEPKMMN